jgi:hypothetical protein
MEKWRLLSLFLATALAVSLGFNVYYYVFDDGASDGSSSNNDASGWMNYTFTWDPEVQDIVNGTFRIDVSIKFENITRNNVTTETFILIVKVHDDDYVGGEYLGLILDTNHNGAIDGGDDPLMLYAGNATITEVGFGFDGTMCPAEIPVDEIYTCTYDPDEGYTFGPYRFAAGEILSYIDHLSPQATYFSMWISFPDRNFNSIGWKSRAVCFQLWVYPERKGYVEPLIPIPTYNVQITNVNATVVDQPVTIEGKIDPPITFKRVELFIDGSGTDVLTDKDGNFKKIYPWRLTPGTYTVYAKLGNSTSNIVQFSILGE